jgi:PAS domain S-box-containing protein
MRESMQTLDKWQADYRVVLPSKGIRWIRGEGDPVLLRDGTFLWTGYMRDITERKKIEQKLEEKKQRLQFALEGSRDGVWDWNVATNKTFYSNESKWMVGFEVSDSFETADFWNDRVHPDDLSSYYQDIQSHFDGKTPFYTNEHRVRCKDGNYKWILDRGKVISRNSQGEVTRVIGTHSDIDQQKKREFEFEKTIGVIESQNDRLTNFAHIVSHNLKSYAGNFESLLTMSKESDDVVEKAEYFNYLEDVSKGLTETIGHLNEIVTVQTSIAENAQSVNLHEFINKAIQILSGEIYLKGAVVENAVPTSLNISYNPAYLESIVLNLISNGLKYADKDRSPILKIEATVNGAQVLLKFTDNGIGIDLAKFGKRLFGMYQTFHGNKDAKGIGLFLTKNQLTAMGDEISVNSTPGAGSTFQITLHKKRS